jgi:predicted signal transduction protein with EAL and GGDEF domain
VGRVHNCLLFAASVAAVALSTVTATPGWITAGFYILVALWFPSMALGWWHVSVLSYRP